MNREYKHLVIIGAVLLVVVAFLVFKTNDFSTESSFSGVRQFKSLDELSYFLLENSDFSGVYSGIDGRGSAESFATGVAPAVADSSKGSVDYSTTNIQVEGVDEPDIIKSDGEFFYLVSGKKVFIVKVYPADEMEITDEISFDDYVGNIFISNGKLVVFAGRYEYLGGPCYYDYAIPELAVDSISAPCGGYSKEETLINVYSVEDGRASLEREYYVSGNFREARMIDDIIYLITDKYVNLNNFNLPVYYDGFEKEILAREIYYFDSSDSSYVFNIISSIDLIGGEMKVETFLLGNSYNYFVSDENIYFVMRKSMSKQELLESYAKEVAIPALPSGEARKIREILDMDVRINVKSREIGEVVSDYADSLSGANKIEFLNSFSKLQQNYYEKIYRESDVSVVHRVGFNGLNIFYDGFGEVPGNVLNQFSLDEREGYFRIATTTGDGWRTQSYNNLYVLDENMDIIGRVEDLAKGERIYSVRFLGDKAFMVTFRQVDPLFVVDLENPREPKVLGELKITGYSGYLHPYDESFLIGVGMEASEEGRIQGVKISLFDVSDFSNPREVAKYVVEENGWSSTDVLYDHKAFLFNKERNLLVLPISNYGLNKYWQGVYVFNINENEISLKGKVAHEVADVGENYWYGGGEYVRRALYIEDVLYTFSQKFLKANSLQDLRELSQVSFSYEEPDYSIYGIR